MPLFAQIGRLDPQKGWDLLAQVAESFLERDVQLVVLGEGDPNYHALLEKLARQFPGKCWAYLGFSDDLAHQIEAGADLFLMPSLFEPCGLNQLYSLAHGTVPDRAGDRRARPTRSSTPTRRPLPRAPPTASSSPRPIRRRSCSNASTVRSAFWPDRATWRQIHGNGNEGRLVLATQCAASTCALYEEIKRRALARNIPLDSSDPPSRAAAADGNRLSLGRDVPSNRR